MKPLEARAHFGRKKGYRLRASMAARFETTLPAVRLDLAASGAAALTAQFSERIRTIRLEIGFGGAEHLLHQAQLYPDIGFIGCEAFEEGVAKALAGIERLGLDNVRLHFGDALEVLHWLPDESIERAYLLYPDPWPKRRHWKRRFVSRDRMTGLARILRPRGELRFASDISSNIAWTLSHAARTPSLSWRGERAADWRMPWEDWISTRYEQKALREGRKPAYFIFQRE